MAANDEDMIRQLINDLADAWNRGDAEAEQAHRPSVPSTSNGAPIERLTLLGCYRALGSGNC